MDGSKLNKSQSKYYNTACLMNEALIILLDKKEYAFITVKEICEKAGVNRSTFYLHYETMEDLLNETIEYVGKKLTIQFSEETVIDKKRIKTCPLTELLLISPKYLYPYLKFVKDNKKLFKVAYSQPSVMKVQNISTYLYNEIFEPILIRFNVPLSERLYRLTFYLHGVSAVIIRWVTNDCKEDVEEIADVLIKCLNLQDEK